MERRLFRHSALDGRRRSCYICVLIFIIFYMFVVFGVMMFKKADLRMRAC
jgi:hypothetical protein